MHCNQFSGNYTKEVESHVFVEWTESTGQSCSESKPYGLLYERFTNYNIWENCESWLNENEKSENSVSEHDSLVCVSSSHIPVRAGQAASLCAHSNSMWRCIFFGVAQSMFRYSAYLRKKA